MPLDYSGLLGPAPQSGAERGQRFFGDALDAVLQRRQAMKEREMQLAAQAEEGRKQRLLTQGYYDQQDAQADRTRGEAERHNQATEAGAATAAAGVRATAESTMYGKAGDFATQGLGELAGRMEAPFLRLSNQPAAAPPRPAMRAAPTEIGPAGPMASPLDARPPPGRPLPPPPVDPTAAGDVTPMAAAGLEPGPLRPLDPGFTGAPGQPGGQARQRPTPGPIADPLDASVQGLDWKAMGPQALVDQTMANRNLDPRLRRTLESDRGGFGKREDVAALLNAERNRESHERNAVAARGASTQRGNNVLDVRVADSADRLLNSIARRTDLVETSQKYRDTEKMLADFASDNPAQQRGAAGNWAKGKAGVGAVTDRERDYFVNTVGGKDEALKAKLNDWLRSGEIPEDQLAWFTSAIRDFEIPRQRKRMQDIENITYGAFAKHPLQAMRQGYPDWAVEQIRSRAGLPPGAGAPATADDIDAIINGTDEEDR